jgi:hypothetical protein
LLIAVGSPGTVSGFTGAREKLRVLQVDARSPGTASEIDRGPREIARLADRCSLAEHGKCNFLGWFWWGG